MSEDIKKQNTEFVDIVGKTIETVYEDRENLSQSLVEIVDKETPLNLEESKKVVKGVSDTIDLVDSNFKDLQEAKSNGKSTTQWLKGKLDETVEKYGKESSQELIDEVKASLNESNGELGNKIFEENVELSEISTNSTYEDINKIKVADDFKKQMQDSTLLETMSYERGKITFDEKYREIQAVKDYFESELDSSVDSDFIKTLSTATIIGQKNGKLPKEYQSKTPKELAMMVEKGANNAKVAYKVENQEISPIDALEYEVDKNVARLNSVIVSTTTEYGGILGGKVGTWIGSLFSPAGAALGNKIGTVVGKFGGEKVGEFVAEGVKKVAKVAKDMAKKAWEGAKKLASKAWDTLTSWL